MEGTVMATMVEALGTGRQRDGLAQAYATVEAGARNHVAKNVALFFAAPFIGLAYVIAFPFVGVVAVLKAVCR
jgi:hypothetical protein